MKDPLVQALMFGLVLCVLGAAIAAVIINA